MRTSSELERASRGGFLGDPFDRPEAGWVFQTHAVREDECWYQRLHVVSAEAAHGRHEHRESPVQSLHAFLRLAAAALASSIAGEEVAPRSPAVEARLAQLEARVAELERQADREMQDYLRREAEAFALVADLPEPPDYGTDDPWQIAHLGLEGLSRADIDRLFEEE